MAGTVPIRSTAVESAPKDYSIPAAQEILLLSVQADFIDNGAASDWLPVFEVLDNNGNVLVRAVDQGVKITAGGDATVSWFPWVRRKTPCPPCDYGVTNCGGTGLGPIASGTGDTTLTLTLTRDVACGGTLHVVAAGVTIGSAFPDVSSVVNSVTDSRGFAYNLADSGAAQIGPIGQQSDSSTDRLIVGPTAIRVCGAHDMQAGDTITVGFFSDYPLLFQSVGMAFVIENTLSDAVTSAFNDTVRYADGDSYNGISVTPNELSWQADGFDVSPTSVAGLIAANAAYPPVGPFSPASSTKLGEVTGALSLAFNVISHIEANTQAEPGGTWSDNANALAGNFQFITLTGA